MSGDEGALAEVEWHGGICACSDPGWTHATDLHDWLAAHDAAIRAEVPEWLDDAVCDCIMAARYGRYDGVDVASHLNHLLDRIRAAQPTEGES